MFRRRLFVPLVLLLVVAALVAPINAPISQAQAANVDVYGRTLPKDAAPYKTQVAVVERQG